MIDVKLHKKFLSTLLHYEMIILVRIWAGCALTKAHRHTLAEEVDPRCECDEENQTIYHLLYRCPIRPCSSPLVHAWARQPPCSSVSLLCLMATPEELLPAWKEDVREPSLCWLREERGEWSRMRVGTLRGDHTGRYAFCSRCFVARKIRDWKLIASKPCALPLSAGLVEGEFREVKGHRGELHLATWKLSGLRPAFRCTTCSLTWWATSGPKRRCGQNPEGRFFSLG